MAKKEFTPAQKIAKESTISFVGMGYGQIIRYLFTAILARLVGAHYLGIYSLGNSITNLTTVVGKAGTDFGIMRFVSRRDQKKEIDLIRTDILSTLKTGFIFSIIVMIFQIIAARWLVENVFHESSLLQIVLIVFALSIPFTTLTLIATSATQGFRLLKYQIFVEYIINPTILILSLIFIYYTFSAELAIILPTLITGIVGFCAANFFLKKIAQVNIFNCYSAKINKEILTFSIPIMCTVIIGSLLHWMDILMLGYFTNAETVGLYHPAARTAGLQQSILVAFAGIFAPMFSRYFAQNDVINMEHIYMLVTRWIITLTIPVLILIVLFAKKMMLLFGAEFITSANALVLLVVGTTVFSVFGLSARALVVSGYQNINLINATVVMIINIILNILLIPKLGILGAAYATSTSMVILSLIRVFEIKIYLKIFPINVKVLKPIIAGIVTFIVLFLIKPLIMEYHTILTLLLALIVTILIYFTILFIFKFDEDDLDFFRSIKFLQKNIIKNSGE